MVAGGATERLPTAAGALGAQAPGLLSMERYCDSSARLVLEQVERLAGALAASARDIGGNAQVLGSWHCCAPRSGAVVRCFCDTAQMQCCRVSNLHQVSWVPAPATPGATSSGSRQALAYGGRALRLYSVSLACTPSLSCNDI